jgi:hypothetical protein
MAEAAWLVGGLAANVIMYSRPLSDLELAGLYRQLKLGLSYM